MPGLNQEENELRRWGERLRVMLDSNIRRKLDARPAVRTVCRRRKVHVSFLFLLLAPRVRVCGVCVCVYVLQMNCGLEASKQTSQPARGVNGLGKTKSSQVQADVKPVARSAVLHLAQLHA